MIHPRSARDFLGYGSAVPTVAWPGGRRVAVSFVVNFEEGAELSMADGDARNESVYEVIDGQPRIDPCIDSHFEFGTRVGWGRIAGLFQRFGVPFTLSTCGRAAERLPWLVQQAVQQGHEVAAHGWRWESPAGLDADAERALIRRAADAIAAASGQRPRGWHTRSGSTPHTRRLLVEEGFLYDSDAYNDDTPYTLNVAGRRHLVLPYAFDTNDMQFQHTQRFATGREFARYVCDAFDWLAREASGEAFGEAGGPAGPARMLSVGLHLRMIGRAGRIGALESIVAHVQRGGAWVATREQIARHWLAQADAIAPLPRG